MAMGDRRLKTCVNKAAAEKKPEAYPYHPPCPEPAKTGSFPMGYVEDFFEARTHCGKTVRLGAPGVGG